MNAALLLAVALMRIVLPHEFTPRDYQRRYMAYLDNGGKRAVRVWHRRAGKDLTSLHQVCKMAHERKALYWHCLPTYRQAKKALWDGFTKDGKRIIESAFPSALVRRRNESEMLLELKCGSIVQLIGSDNVDTLVGAGPAGVTFSEYSISKPTAWNLIRPMLAENGGWASFIYTPRGNNHGRQLYDMARKTPGWDAELLTIHDTGALPLSVLEEERSAGMPEALIRQEYLCDFSAANVGAVWGDLIEALEKAGGLDGFEHERDGVFTSWDLGYTDSTAIWFWRLRDGGVEFIDHYEAHGRPMSHYFDVLDSRREALGYKYVKHWLPHDARAKTLQTGESIAEQCVAQWGPSLVAITPQLDLLDGIQAGRWLLQQAVRFHPRASAGVEALKQYHYEYNEDAKTFGKKPEHDWSSHTADAFRYAAVVARMTEQAMRRVEVDAPKPGSVDELFAKHMSSTRRRRA
jgi:phage terminase large subunit